MDNNTASAAAASARPAPGQPSSAIVPINFINLDGTNLQRQSLFGEDAGVQIKCCAHDECMIPPGIHDQIGNSTHKCFNCTLKIHSPLTCGDTLQDILLLDENTYDKRCFSIFGRQSLEGTTDAENLYLCYTCLGQIKEATELLPGPFQPPRRPQSSIAAAAAAPTGGSRIALLLPPGESHTTKKMNEVMNDDRCITELTYSHVIVSAGATNKVANKKDSPLTQLKGIMLGVHEFPTIKCSNDNLRKLAMRWGIKNARTMGKKAVADALVVYRARQEQHAIAGTLEQTDGNGAPLRMNTERYLNVLFGSVMTALLKVRGRSLTAKELQNKLKTDEAFHRALIKEYNDSSKAAYGQNAHGTGCGYKDASNFQVIPEDMWEKSRNKFNELNRDYEFYTNKWRQSGNHGSFEDIEPPPEKECANPAMIYMHHHLRDHPELLEVCLGLLPDDVFRQSSSDPPRGGARGGNARRGRGGRGGRGGGGGRGSGGRAKSAAAEDCLDSIKHKNNAQQQNILLETNKTLREEMQKEKKNKKACMEKLVSVHFDDKETAKRSIKRFKQNNGSGGTNNTQSVESDDEDFTESQESTLGNYVETMDNIEFLQGQLDKNKAALNKLA